MLEHRVLPPSSDAVVPPDRPVARAMLLAVWLGLVAGLIEAIVRLSQRLVPNKDSWRGDVVPEMLWIAPLFNLLLFGAVGALLVLVLRVVAPRLRLEPPLYAMAAPAILLGIALGMQQFYRWELYWWAFAFLCLGVAVQVYRWTRHRPPTTMSGLRRDFLRVGALAVLVNVAGRVIGMAPVGPPARQISGGSLGLPGLLALPVSRRGLFAAPVAVAQVSSPNVLLVVLDTVRADHLSAFGYLRPTSPNLEHLAREGVLFENAFTTGSWTLPVHATLFTGRHAHEHGAHDTPLNARYPTVAEYFLSRGYATGAFTANNQPARAASGFGRGFEVYQDYYANPADMVYRTTFGSALAKQLYTVGYYNMLGRKDAETVNREFLGWLTGRPNEPFFAFLNYFDAHDPYIAPPPFDRMFSEEVNRGDRINHYLFDDRIPPDRKLSVREIQLEIDAYDETIAYLDSQLGALIERLSAAGRLDNTVLVVTSDHGEQFNNHRLFGHRNSLYRELLQVPLVIRWPRGLAAGQRVQCLVSLQSFATSVVTMAGLGEGSPFSGTPFAEAIAAASDPSHAHDGEAVFAEHLSTGSRARKSVITPRWHLIVNRSSRPELYRTDTDPRETENLRETDEGEEVIEDLTSRMSAFLKAGMGGDPDDEGDA